MSDDESPRLKDTKEMLGEFLREVASLVLVFVPLEVAIGPHTWRKLVCWTISACTTSGLALWYGVRLEKRRLDDGSSSFRDTLRVHLGSLRRWFAKQEPKDE